MHDPLTVPCPDCTVPAGTPCAGDYDEAHATRTDNARYAAATEGTCGRCTRPLMRLTDPDDAIHTDPADAAACPPIPDALANPTGWRDAINAGLLHGHPGVDAWLPPNLEATHDQLLTITGAATPGHPSFTDQLTEPNS